MLRFTQFAFFVTAITFAAEAFAHGPQLQITNNGNKIVTRQIMTDTYSPITPETRIFSFPLNPVLRIVDSAATELWLGQPNLAYSESPGLAYGMDTDPFDAPLDNSDIFLGNGDHFEIKLLDGLKVWNGAGFVDPGTEQALLFRTSGSAATTQETAVTVDGGPTNTPNDVLVFADILGINPGSHAGAFVSILGDGSSFSSTPDNGVYLIQMQLTSTQLNVSASDPYFFLLNKGKTLAEAGAAISFLQSTYNINAGQVQLIPEPSVWIAASGLVLVGLYRCSQRKLEFNSLIGRS